LVGGGGGNLGRGARRHQESKITKEGHGALKGFFARRETEGESEALKESESMLITAGERYATAL